MILPVVGTIGTRVLIAVMNLCMVAVSAHFLGISAVGSIALLVLGISFILLFNDMVGGSGLVYLTPRHGTAALRWPAYGWAILTGGLAWIALRTFPLVPAGMEVHAVALALLQGLAGVHLGLLLGRERYGAYNSLQLLGSVLFFIAYIILLRNQGSTVMDYVHAAYIAHGTNAIISGILSIDRRNALGSASHPLVELFRQGILSQLGNGLQLLNYRMAYYLVRRFQGDAALGLFSITTQLAEGAWLAPKSLGTVLYARVSNLADRDHQRDLTLAVFKVAVGIAAVAVLVLCSIPDAVYQFVFGPAVHGIASIVVWLTPGLLAMSASQAISHYLSGSGRVYHNVISSGIGVIVTLLVGYRAIPTMGLYGAALTASAAYSASVLYQFVVFNKISGARLHHYLPSAMDVERIRTLWHRMLGR